MQSNIRPAAVAGIALAALGLAACDFENPFETLTMRIDIESAPTQAALRLDNHDFLVESATVTFSGPDADRVVDLLGNPVTGFEIQPQGMEWSIGFGLTGPVPTPESPAKLVATVESDQLLRTGLPLVIDGADAGAATIGVVFRDDWGEPGIVRGWGQVDADQNGTVHSAEELVVGSSGAGRARVAIPSGTVILDAHGQPLSGALDAVLLRFDPDVEDALRRMPGGLTVALDGGGQRGALESVGLLALELEDAAGRTARTASQLVSVRVAVSDRTWNPETGGLVADGDPVPVWGFDPGTGRWQHLTDGSVIGPAVDGYFQAEFETVNLEHWNLGWLAQACAGPTALELEGHSEHATYGYTLRFADTGRYFGEGYTADAEGRLAIHDAPADRPVDVRIHLLGETVGSATLPDACQGGPVGLEPGPRVAVDIRMSGPCEGQPGSGSVHVRPTLPVWAFEPGAGELHHVGYMRSGAAVLGGFRPDRHYEIRMPMGGDGAVFELPIQPGQQEVIEFETVFPSGLCG